MRKITLFIFMLFTIIGGAKADKVLYNNVPGSLDNLDVSTSGVKAGDVFVITISGFEEGYSDTSLNLTYWNGTGWSNMSTCEWQYKNSSGTYEFPIEEADLSHINGSFSLVHEHAYVTYFGIRYANQPVEPSTIWAGTVDASTDESQASTNVSFSVFSAGSVGDVLRFNLTPNESSYHQMWIKYVTGDGWSETADIIEQTGTSGSYFDMTITAAQLAYLQGASGENPKAVRIYVKNNTLTSIQLIKPLSINDTADPRCEAGNYAKVNLTRNLAVGYNTLCLPFAATKAELGLEGSDVIYEMAEGSSSSNIKFSSVEAIVANKPYLVYCAAARTLTTAFTGLDVSVSDASSTSIGDWTMYGNYEPGADINGKYIIYNGEVRKCGSGPTLNGLRAYFTYSGGSLVKNATISFDETGITNVGNEDYSQTDFYNLAGQSTKKPKHGIYVVKGKKVLFK